MNSTANQSGRTKISPFSVQLKMLGICFSGMKTSRGLALAVAVATFRWSPIFLGTPSARHLFALSRYV